MKERLKRTGRIVVSKGKFVLMLAGILILGLLIKKVGVRELWDIIRGMNPFYVMLAVVPWVLTLFSGAYRLKHIVDSDLSFFEVFRIYIYGYLLNYASPIQGFGAGAKIAMLKMKKIKISRSSASVSSEIAYDIILTLVIASVFFLYHINFVVTQLDGMLNTKLFIAAGVIVVFVLVMMWFFRKNDFVREFFSHLRETFRLRRVRYIAPATFFSWILPAITIYLFFVAAGIKVSFWVVLGSICIGFILGLASFIPGGLGIRDAITAYIYSISGAPLETTISIAIFNRFFTIGTVLLMVLGIKVKEWRRG
ncbi:hypothetical protein COV19_05645 [Candidatus Woesearchaeota archaeon CG10_big_fil_rev_8_21_14_0_10_44_13]|nr:MAG: hypothetical protein COV19_05645 [Candidatus Woesearchaeota archaeon CG10_big_fil_rev_8_21_14_0_10_44_13]